MARCPQEGSRTRGAFTPSQFVLAAAGLLENMAASLRDMATYDEAELVAAVSGFPHDLKAVLRVLSNWWAHVDFQTPSQAAAVAAACARLPDRTGNIAPWHTSEVPDGLSGETVAELVTLAGDAAGSVVLHPGRMWGEHFDMYFLLDLWKAGEKLFCT
jgi:hypothetical protein